jgi:hypothetical protein
MMPSSLEIKESPIHGLGVFTKNDILEKTLIGYWVGVKYANRAAYEAVHGKDYRYTYYSPFPWNPVYSCRENRNFSAIELSLQKEEFKLFAKEKNDYRVFTKIISYPDEKFYIPSYHKLSSHLQEGQLDPYELDE